MGIALNDLLDNEVRNSIKVFCREIIWCCSFWDQYV